MTIDRLGHQVALLKRGSRGSGVTDLQTTLNGLGYEPPLAVDGAYGPKTEAAVRWYQEQNGLDVDGIAGPDTLNSLDDRDMEHATGDDAVDDDHLNDARFNGIPGNPEVWKNTDTGMSYLVYFAEGMEPPLPMIWEIPSDRDLEAFFGPDVEIVYDHEFTQDQIDSTGGMIWGTSTEIVDTEEDPLEGWASKWERERLVRPYLNDPEVYALYASAALEGRSVSVAELESTEWMRTKSETERAWLITNASDPITAQQMIEDNRRATFLKLQKAGIEDPSEAMVNYMADQLTTGMWRSNYFDQQITAVSDPSAGISIDAGITNVMGDSTWDTTSEMEDKVRNTVIKWLGTDFGNWDDDTIASWAGRFRNEDDAEAVLLETLKDQREAMFPGYDREADYDTIAAPWRNVIRSAWGEIPNDSDKILQSIIRMNNAGDAGKLLTQEGMARGNDTVVNNVQASLNRAFGGR